MLSTTPRTDPQLRLAADRRHFEQLVVGRYGPALSREDAEDVVADALLEAAGRCPEDAADGGRGWFARVCLNRAEDLRRARHGRPRAARGPRAELRAVASVRRFVALDDPAVAPLLVAPSRPDEEVERELEREEARRVVTRALAALDATDAELLRRRHLDEAEPSRQEVAEALGLSLASFEVRATRARRALASALEEQLQAA